MFDLVSQISVGFYRQNWVYSTKLIQFNHNRSKHVFFEITEDFKDVCLYLIQKDRKISERERYCRTSLLLFRIRDEDTNPSLDPYIKYEYITCGQLNARGGTITAIVGESVFLRLKKGKYVVRLKTWSKEAIKNNSYKVSFCAYSDSKIKLVIPDDYFDGKEIFRQYGYQIFLKRQKVGQIDSAENKLCKWYMGFEQMYLLWVLVNSSSSKWTIKANFDMFEGLKWAKPFNQEQRELEVTLEPGEKRLVYAKEHDSTKGSVYHCSWKNKFAIAKKEQ